MAARDFNASDDLVPSVILLRLLRDVWHPLEAKVVLAVASLGGMQTPVAEETLLVYPDLRRGARGDGSERDAGERILEALEVATVRGILLRLVDHDERHWLLLGTEENQHKVRTDGITLREHDSDWSRSLKLERPSIFTLYEQNIGLVTPIIADRLVEAIERYPEAWIAEAIAEAVSYNRRSWRYVQRILENWATEGRADETNRRSPARDRNREKHLRGKYAHLFRRNDLPDL